MGATPHTGVVNPSGEVWGVHGLFVAGAATFPTSGFANPTLTAVALAFRLAEHLAHGHQLKRARRHRSRDIGTLVV